MADEDVIDTKDMPLEAWLALIFDPPEGRLFVSNRFPSDAALEQYLATIHVRPEQEVLRLLRHFLIPSGKRPLTDLVKLRALRSLRETSRDAYERTMRHTFYQRLVMHYLGGRSDVLPWEGNTWVLDLLPDHPHQALQVLDAYATAHIHLFSDGQIEGWSDAEEVIRAKFIGLPGTHGDTINLLLNEGPRTFECLVERLYNAMGYKTTLTPPKKDGGRDVIARKDEPGQQERLLVECKLWSGPVGVRLPRELLGVVSDDKANKGVLVTNSRFTKPARAFAERNPRLELIAGRQLVPLMNRHLGARWPLRIETLAREAEKQA